MENINCSNFTELEKFHVGQTIKFNHNYGPAGIRQGNYYENKN